MTDGRLRASAVLDRFWDWRNSQRERFDPPGRDGTWTPARLVFETVWDVLEGREIEAAFDPWSTSGLILTSVVESGRANRGLGVCRTPADREAATTLSGQGVPIDWRPVVGASQRTHDGQLSMGLDSEESLATTDLVVSMPPWNVSDMPGVRDPTGIKDWLTHLLLLHAWARMKPNAVAVSVLSPAFAFRRQGVRDHLADFGLRLDAVIELPAGSFAPSTQLGGTIVVIEKGPERLVFGAALTGDQRRDGVALGNLRARRTDEDDPSLGLLAGPREFSGVASAVGAARTRRLERATGTRAVPLQDLVTSVSMGRPETDFDEEPDAVYLPIVGRRPAVISAAELELKPQSYVQLRVRQDLVSSGWLAGYLSSPLGVEARESCLAGGPSPRMTRESVRRIPVFLPPIAQQVDAVSAWELIVPMRDEINDLGRSLWLDPHAISRVTALVGRLKPEESLTAWMEQLPFPLASILWSYNAAGSDARARYDHLLHFFEALAEFNALILLSAVLRDEHLERTLVDELRDALQRQSLSLEHASFGAWRVILSFLAKRLRTLMNSEEGRTRIHNLLRVHNPEVVEMLLGKALPAMLEKVNSYRNEWKGHGGVVGHDEARRRHAALAAELSSTRRIMGDAWTRYELVLPMAGRYRGNRYHYEVRRVMGRSFPFEAVNVAVAAPLIDGSLHFLGSGEGEALPLLPLVRMGATPSDSASACYFYSKRERGEARFVSYHFEQEAEIRDRFPDVDEVLSRISSPRLSGSRAAR